MEPQEIDKLFNERLKRANPTPPADLWNRLQERIETEMPAPQMADQQKEEQPVIRMWTKSYYGIAAAITLLLAAGLAFFNLSGNLSSDANVIAQQDAFTTELPSQTQGTGEAAIASDTEAEVKPAEAPAMATAPATKPAAQAKKLAVVATKAAESNYLGQRAAPAVTETPVQPLKPSKPTVAPATIPAQLALQPVPTTLPTTTDSGQPVEIVIKRTSTNSMAATAAEVEEEELSGFEKKQRLAKGIFRQARNLTTGERIDLSDLGINANRIALETQIGNQKISKVINL